MGLPVARDMEGRVLTEILEPDVRAGPPGHVHPELREPRGRPGRARRAARRPAAPARRRPREAPARPLRHRRHAALRGRRLRPRARGGARRDLRHRGPRRRLRLLGQDRPPDRARADARGRPRRRGDRGGPPAGARALPRPPRGVAPARARPGEAGVVALLEALEREPGVTLGLLTGNLEPCARLKLEPLGANRHFAFGAYGSDHEDRYRLPAGGASPARARRTGIALRG